MKIKHIELENFRGINRHTFILDKRSTVFFGVNGVGKSTVLRAINLIYSNIINKIVQNKFKQGINIEIQDIKYGASHSRILVLVSLQDELFSYGRFMTRKDAKRTHSGPELDALYSSFKSNYLFDENDNMPIYVNYSVNRAVIDIPLRITKKHTFDKLSAFEKAIENRIDFRTFFEWFRNREDYENQIKVRQNINYIDSQLECVRKAILIMLDGFSNLRIERDPLRMAIKKGNISLRVEQLSDGEKCTLAMIGDLARRLSIANPKLINPLEGEGVVLIDEIELHMHPKWQRRIINTLRDIFPNIQFLITTHSPQVLGEVGEDINIFKINNENNEFESVKINSLDAWDSNYILEGFMETSSLNLHTKGAIARMYELIAEGKYEEALTFVDELEKKTDSAHEDVVKAKILISRGKRGK